MDTEDLGCEDYNSMGMVDVNKIDPGGPGDEVSEFISRLMKSRGLSSDFSYI